MVSIALVVLAAACAPTSTTSSPASAGPPSLAPSATPAAAATGVLQPASPGPGVGPSTRAPAPGGGGLATTPCGPGDAFTVSPIASEMITSITPLGALDAPSHIFPTDHIYVNVPGRDRSHQIVAVVSPGTLRVWRITSQTRTGDLSFSDFKLEFALCGGLRAHFAHLGELSPRLLGAFEAAKADCRDRQIPGGAVRTCAAEVSVALVAAEPVGRTNPTATGLDFGAFDPARTLPFVTPERYRMNLNTLGAICPLDLFSADVRAWLAARLGASEPTFRARTAQPVCGEVMQDRPGTAQGNWIVSGRPSYPEDFHLSFVHDNVDPRKPILAVGLSVRGLAPGVYSYGAPAAGANPDPADIAADGAVRCLDGLRARQSVGGRILLALTAAGLDIEYEAGGACGVGPWLMREPLHLER